MMPVTPRLSIVTPAWNEEGNLPALYERLREVLDALGVTWEWIVVDDRSRDRTFDVVGMLAARDPRVRGVRLARNSGSHLAIACGLEEAAGEAAVVLAADLQDPPETLADLLARWRAGAQVVWAARRSAPSNAGFAAVYYWIMRRIVGFREMPVNGADFFLIDRAVIDALRQCRERHVSVLALIAWLGFRQEQIEYEKQPRLHGTSGWGFRRKVKLVIDSVTGFSDLPVTACWTIGGVLLALSALVGIGGLLGLGVGVLAPPHVVLLAAVGAVGGLLLLMLGLIGEYVWRALEEGRGRPRYIVDGRVGPRAAAPVASPADALRG
jgi:dolichol-phosphate mannosyltransferase